jgi:hypothetical protein
MRYLSALVLLLPLVAALPSSPIEARGGKRCSTSPQCGNASLYCKRGTCSPRRELNGPCYKDIGCQSSRCVNKRCVKAEAPTTPALLALGAKCATSVSCASGYCGKARCAVPLPVGSDCYKAVSRGTHRVAELVLTSCCPGRLPVGRLHQRQVRCTADDADDSDDANGAADDAGSRPRRRARQSGNQPVV